MQILKYVRNGKSKGEKTRTRISVIKQLYNCCLGHNFTCFPPASKPVTPNVCERLRGQIPLNSIVIIQNKVPSPNLQNFFNSALLLFQNYSRHSTSYVIHGRYWSTNPPLTTCDLSYVHFRRVCIDSLQTSLGKFWNPTTTCRYTCLSQTMFIIP